MSNGLAIAGVSYLLHNSLVNLYGDPSSPFTGVNVTSIAPDQVQSSFGDLNNPENRVNLFLHQVTHNPGWRNVDLPWLASDGKTQLQSPPLALDLHYLLTVYGSESWQAEALLGYALMMLHEIPVLTRSDITNALAAASGKYGASNPIAKLLDSCGLADQVEMLKITPETLGREEMAWLWTALKADYRPTFPFQVTVVLMQPQQQTSLALPVLSRGVTALPIQPARILSVSAPSGQAAASTDTVSVIGEFLSGIGQVRLTNSRFEIDDPIAVTDAGNTTFTFIPNAGFTNPAGLYTLTAQVLDAQHHILQSTLPIDFAIAPTLPAQTAIVTPNPQGKLVKVTMSPNVREGQTVSLVLSGPIPPPPGTAVFTCSAPAQTFTGNVGALSFQFPSTLPSGPLLGRLIVDSVPSQVQVTPNVFPPTFSGPMVTI
ncbi:MAG: DUF4255 domain-containing protein [Candidatus Cybelea sp.]